MAIEIVGTLIFHDGHGPAIHGAKNFDPAFMLRLVQQFDACGYDRLLVPQSTHWPDSMPVAMWVTAVTKRLAVMVAHRPGFVAPTMAARMFATLDQLSGGRAGIHVITGGNDLELQCDGDYLAKEQRYQRSREFVAVLRAIWAAETPVSHSGEFYHFSNSLSQLRPLQQPSIPVYWGGASEAALQGAGACADIYSLGLSSLEDTGRTIEKVRAVATAAGRTISFQGAARVIIADTEAKAWDKARAIAQKLQQEQADKAGLRGGGRVEEQLSTKKAAIERLMATAGQDGEIVDERLWTGTRTASKGGISPAMVGTPTQVAEAYLRYYDLGVRSFFLRGFDEPLADIQNIGAKLIPLMRAGAAARAKSAA